MVIIKTTIVELMLKKVLGFDPVCVPRWHEKYGRSSCFEDRDVLHFAW